MLATLPQIGTTEWLDARRRGIGASEAGAILGLSAKHAVYRTALEVYLDKLGLMPRDEAATWDRRGWGLRWERLIADAYTEATGRELSKATTIIVNPDAPWMLASLDFHGADGRPVEIKKVSAYSDAAKFFGEAGTDQLPEGHYLQVQQQIACAEVDSADLAALIGDDDFRIFTVNRNQPIIDKLAEAEREFMERVERRDPPLPDFTHPSTADILAMIEPDLGTTIDLGAEATALADEYQALGKAEGETASRRREIKARLLHLMGVAEKAYLPDGRTMRRKPIERAGYTVAPASYVDFRILNPKS